MSLPARCSTSITQGATGLSLRLVLVATVLAVWEAAVRFFEIPQFILPTPTSIFAGLWRGLAELGQRQTDGEQEDGAAPDDTLVAP